MQITTAQFNDSYFPIMDGVGMTAHNYAYWLNKKYGRSLLVAPKVKGYKDHVDYPVIRFKSALLPGMNPYRIGLPHIDIKFKKKLKRLRVDLIHAHCPFVSGQLATKLSSRLNIPLVATFHTKYREDFKKVINNDMFVDFLVKMTLDFYHMADLVWVPNEATGQTLRDYGYKGLYEVMRNGTDFEKPEKDQLELFREKGREMIHSETVEFTMLFVGQHRWEKNVRLILDSLKLLKEAGLKCKMVFVGEGYAASDLLVFPSVYDNSPLVIQEAAAFGIPAVVVAGSSAAEGITDGLNGFLTENETGSLTRKLTELMEHPNAVKKAGRHAAKTLYHSWEGIADEVYKRYVELIRLHHPAVVHQSEDDEE
jgi:glycosyltransferase involved in cell wall biosynthesis